LKKISSKSIICLIIIFIGCFIHAFIECGLGKRFFGFVLAYFIFFIIFYIVFEFFYFIWCKYFKKIKDIKFFKNVNDSIETFFAYFLFFEGLQVLSFILKIINKN
jgi:hypothetical protein